MAQNFFNAATQQETIYAPDGSELVTTRLNALELVRYAGYGWNKQNVSAAAVAAVVDPEPVVAPTVEDVPEELAADAATGIDHKTASLEDLALAMTNSTDVVAFLKSFSVDALRTLAEERYGQRLRTNATLDSAIEKMLAWEEAKIAAESNEV